MVQDDALMLFPPPREVRRTAERLAALGVDRVRLNAGWHGLAPDPDSPRRPQGFDAADPAGYREDGWRRLDTAVAEVERAGMKPMLDVGFWAPRWAVSRPAGGRGRWRWAPSAREFGLFARALARRYDGSGGRPAVRLWTTWNEPNHPLFLLPQWERRDGRLVPAAPHRYRAMHEAAYRALKGVSRHNRVLLGGLTSLGSDAPGEERRMKPLQFVRELACVNRALRPLRRRECRGFRPLRADGFAHHPYTPLRPPDARLPDRDEVGLADLARLSGLLEALRRRGRVASRLPLWVTEYGYETNPPDATHGVPLEVQSRWLAQATAVALATPGLRSHAQFLLRDVPSGHQSGLELVDGRPKPALATFPVAFWVADGVASGQVRPGRGRQRVVIERRALLGPWEAATPEFATGSDGSFRRELEGEGVYRLVWLPRGGARRASVSVRVADD